MRLTKHDRYLAKAAALRDKVRALYATGMTQAKIARQLDITPARVFQILWPGGKLSANSEEVKPELVPKANVKKPKQKAKSTVFSAAAELGRLGAQATNSKLSSQQRSANARKAALAKHAKARAAKAQEGAQ